MRCAGSPTKPSGGAWAANSTGAKPSTTCAASSTTPTGANKDTRFHHDDQTTQALCLTLVTNACVLSTTWYFQDAIDALEAGGHPVSDDTVAHLSPAHFEAITPYGIVTIDVPGILARSHRRPLRSP